MDTEYNDNNNFGSNNVIKLSGQASGSRPRQYLTNNNVNKVYKEAVIFRVPSLMEIEAITSRLSFFNDPNNIDCSATDYTVLCGVISSFGEPIENCDWVTKNKVTISINDEFYSINAADRTKTREDCSQRRIGVRPAVDFSAIKDNCGTKVVDSASGKITSVLFGEYPQSVVPDSLAKTLDDAIKSGTLKKTGKFYTLDESYVEMAVSYREPFRPTYITEYEYNGQKVVRILASDYCASDEISTGDSVSSGSYYWVWVEPIEWMVDEAKNIAVAKNVLFSSIPYCDSQNHMYHSTGRFEDTTLFAYLNGYFAKEIVPSNREYSVSHDDISEYSIEDQKAEEERRARKNNPYGLNFEEVSEEDIIKGALESNIAVFLHGRSSEGKSARVKQFDPDCEIVYMLTARPESLVGKSVYNGETGQMIDIPPTWYAKLKERCDKEPDKLHIVFFDELTNALPSIQAMAYNIVLDREVDGKWKLPPNARVVAAGNEVEESMVANPMPKPLFNRFAHVYIVTTEEEWLEWASKNNIHPAIYAFVAYKSFGGASVLRTEYDGKIPNADPRKWEMASQVLYKTNNPYMLRSLIGPDLTEDFAAFTKVSAITVQDVLDGNYTERDIESMDVSEKFATAVGLSSVSIENFEVVREFMTKLGPEARAAFESMWARNDTKKLEKIQEVMLAEQERRGMSR